ncbi:olfactory receptor 1019 [Xenopus laevis]|uniref:Olfactory receptor n=2 Tax=Xenopus laevis TaxID=8355 RepID=A0A974C177_XENLA|nr:olfactory receptor 1019 [Xenopus laevis]OCT64687.1 hypothetical protein XELAEV_18045784mg [Xenopus laevis]
MESRNVTSVEFYILLGFSHVPYYRLPLISIFTLLYIFTLIGNSLIILLIIGDYQLHTPMYFLLANFSVLDLVSPSISVPKMIDDLISMEGIISFNGCITQMTFFIAITITECYFLSVMAFDRYVAICLPLHYKNIMSFKICFILIWLAWLLGCFHSIIHTILTISLDFCGPNHINHFYCDILSLLQLACSPINLNVTLVCVSAFFNGICNCIIILSSYLGIVSAVLKINSKDGRMKAFCTCASHLLVVSLYYGTLIIAYFRPINSYTYSKDRTISVIYTTVTPMLNPIIYSLRNKSVKNAFQKLWKRAIYQTKI